MLLSYHISYDKGVKNMTTLSASEARKRLYNLVDEVKDTHLPVQIIGKRNSAVLISEDDWRAIEETLYLTAIPGMRESIKKGLKTPVDKCDKELKW
jgi:prevent-host-death family protein